MVTVTNIRKAKPEDFDEIWAIVRSLKYLGYRTLTEIQVIISHTSPGTQSVMGFVQNIFKTER